MWTRCSNPVTLSYCNTFLMLFTLLVSPRFWFTCRVQHLPEFCLHLVHEWTFQPRREPPSSARTSNDGRQKQAGSGPAVNIAASQDDNKTPMLPHHKPELGNKALKMLWRVDVTEATRMKGSWWLRQRREYSWVQQTKKRRVGSVLFITKTWLSSWQSFSPDKMKSFALDHNQNIEGVLMVWWSCSSSSLENFD